MNMNLHITQESMSKQLIDTIHALSRTQRTPEEILEVLEAEYRSHLFVVGTFSLKKSLWGEEIHFNGAICNESISHCVWV